MVFYYKSKKEDVAKVMLKHHAKWVTEKLKKYPMPQRKALYDRLIKESKE